MTDESSARARRRRAVLLGGATAGAARATGMVCALIQVPVLLGLLGSENFGLWATLQATATIVAMLDFGMGYRLQNAITEFSARDSSHGIRPAVAFVLLRSSLIAAALALLALIPDGEKWANLLGVDAHIPGRSAVPYLGLLVALSCATLPANIGLRLASGLQKNWLIGASQSSANVLSLGLVLWFAAINAPVVIVLATSLLVPVATNAVILMILFRGLPRGGTVSAFSPVRGEWLRRSLPYFVPQLCAALRTGLPPFLLATFIGAASVTPFTLLSRLLNFISQPQGWLLDPLWPAYADAASRSDWPWIERALRISLAGSAVFVALPLLSVLAWGPAFIAWWAKFPASEIGSGLLLWLVLAQVALVMTQPLSLCLNGLGRMRGQVLYGSIGTIVSLAGMAWVSAALGLQAAAAPLALGMACINLPCAIVDVRRQLQSSPPSPVAVKPISA